MSDKNDEKTLTVKVKKNSLKDESLNEQNSAEDENDGKNFLKKLGKNVDVFIMSEAGKPIYCYSEREDAVTLMGVCVALMNYVLKYQNDHLRSIHTKNGLHINFAHRSPIVIVVISREHCCFDEQTLINQINAQLILTITLKSLKKVFREAPTYDLKRLIHSNVLRTMDVLVESISSPIADMFYSYRDMNYFHSSKMKLSLFNNVISFYTSTTMPNSALSLNSSSSQTIFGSHTKSTINSSNNHNNSSENSIVVIQECKPNVLSRIYIPIAIMPSTLRDQITNIINQAAIGHDEIVSTILFTIVDDERYANKSTYSSSEDEFVDANDDVSTSDTRSRHFNISERSNESKHSNLGNGKILKIVTICNHTNKLKINPLDLQLIYSLIKTSDQQLSSTESLWSQFCLSKVDVDRFLYGHISYLNKNLCLAILNLDYEGFDECQQMKETIQVNLSEIDLAEPINEIRSNISELGVPQLQYICHQTTRHCIMWQASSQVDYSILNTYLIDRMQKLSLKTAWLRSAKHQCTLLGWHTATFQLYAQFDYNVSQYSALETVQLFIKWFKKEEDKFIIKD